MTNLRKIVRWTLVPVAALLGFTVSFLVAIPLNRLIYFILWSGGHFIPGKMLLMDVLPLDGAIAASLFILFGTWTAPCHKLTVATSLFFIGALAAWYCVGEFYSPEKIVGHGPIRVWWPIIGTCFGGVCTFFTIYLIARKKQKPNQALQHPPTSPNFRGSVAEDR